jgi:hypothetical protein
VSEEPAAEEREDEPEFTWVPTSRWPAEMSALRRDIEEADQVIPLLEGAADDLACHTALDFVKAMRFAGKAELAMRLLELHGVPLPDSGDFQTPQQKMSEGLKRTADVIRANRPDIKPEDMGMRQPPSSRARREPPRYGGAGPLGSLGREE